MVAILLPRRSHLLYVAQLAVLKAGGAYTCIEPGTPAERARLILADARAVAVIVGAAGTVSFPADRTVVLLDEELDEEPAKPAPLPCRVWLSPSTLAYVIYTSGTTGLPKGVMVEHRSIVNLILSDVEAFGLGPRDRVGQSSSAAYDSSVEEIWLAFATGATLVLMDDDVVRLGPDLVPWLRAERIGVFCPPPTLLRMCACDDPARELPDLRLLYVGGEELTADVASRWAPGRWLENGYGPTECTVTVVRGRVRAGEPIAIGRPVPNAQAWILDGALQEVAPGETGELCIGGVSVARGYLNRPDLTRDKFIEHPRYGRIYRTGDHVRRLASGDLAYLGRSDAQVKIRGHRVELSAIESELCTFPGVRAAACKVQSPGGGQELVAFLVTDPGERPGPAALRDALQEKLPEHMLPVRYGFVSELPVSATSGKLNRPALPDLLPQPEEDREIAPPRSAAEHLVARAFSDHLRRGAPVSIHDDFFLDLGGNSLLAAQAVSSLRKQGLNAPLTVRDVYEARTVAALAARLSAGASRPERPRPHRLRDEPKAAQHPALVSLAQLAAILGKILAGSLAAYLAAFRLLPAAAHGVGTTAFLLLIPALALAGAALYTPLALLAAVAAKKVLIGRYRAGRHPHMGSFYLRHWIVQQVARAIPWELAEGTALKNAFLRALGARIGKNVHIHRGVDLRSGGWDLLEIGDGAAIGRDASLGLLDYENQEMVLGPVTIGARCTLDTRSRMAPHSALGAGSVLTALSTLPSHAAVPAGEMWQGVPASFHAMAPPAPRVSSEPSGIASIAAGPKPWPAALHGGLLLLARSLAAQLALLPMMVLAVVFERLWNAHWSEALSAPSAFAPAPILIALGITVAGFSLALPVEALIARLLGPVRPGTYPLYGWTALSIFLKERMVESAGNALSGTLLWPRWLRLAGMRVGRSCEISTIMEVVPELVEIGDECFFADGIYLGRPWIHRGTITCGHTAFAKNTFLGNHVVVPGGAELPSGILVGISTVADAGRIRPGTSWFGNPAFELPRREVVASDRRLTHDPEWYRYVTRLFWESLRLLVPVVPACLGILWLKVLPHWRGTETRAEFFGLTLPAFTVATGACLLALVLLAKWLLLGRVREGRHPLWSCWCSRWDFLYVLWAAYVRGSLASFEGTPFMAWWLRAMGSRIGRRVVLGISFAQVVDPDMLAIGDDATVSCLLQLHSFEDRVLKIAPARIGARCTIGHGAVLLYGASVGDGARVEDGSVVMKHETLLPGQYYVGSPTRPARAPEAA